MGYVIGNQCFYFTDPTTAPTIETVWTLLKRKVYENNWEAKNLGVLARRIKQKSKELDLKMLQRLLHRMLDGGL
jgi:hypothetical protein